MKVSRDPGTDELRRDYELLTHDAAATGPHPDDDVWVRLASGQLADDEHARTVDHVLSCAECSAVYRAVAHVRHGAPAFDPAAPRGVSAGAAPMPKAPVWWQVVAASLTIAAAGLLAWNLTLQRRTTDLQTELEHARRTPVPASPAPRETAPPPAAVQAHVNVPIVDLHPPSRVRGEGARPQVIRIDENSALVTLIVNTESPRRESNYSLDLLDANGTTLWSGTGLAPQGDGTLSVALPTTMLRAGDYAFVLKAGGRTVHRYPVTFAAR